MAIRARGGEFQTLFGECEDAAEIEQIKNNDPALDDFCPTDVDDLTAEAWRKLGSYIAGNDYLRYVDLSGCNLDPSKFRGLSMGGAALRRLTFFKCQQNWDIDSTCFDLLLDSLEGGAIEDLNVGSCSIKNPMALARCTLPKLRSLDLGNNGITDLSTLANITHLESLDLSNNSVEEGGFRAIADLLQHEGCSLKHLHLQYSRMGDAGAIVLTESLKCNTELENLDVRGNDLGHEGLGAFLKLLNDVSSIKKTENSNHTLRDLGICRSRNEYDRDDLWEAEMNDLLDIRPTRDDERRQKDMKATKNRIYNALETNSEHPGNPQAAGRDKVRETQLCRRTREELCHLQGIECSSYHQLFSDLDTVLLPDVLALVGERSYAQNELYPVVVAKASDLASLIDRETMIRGEKAKNEARIAAITAELARLNVVNSRLERQLISIEAGESEGNVLGSKRSRDAAA